MADRSPPFGSAPDPSAPDPKRFDSAIPMAVEQTAIDTFYIVGCRMPGWQGPVVEGSTFTIDSSGARLQLAYYRPMPQEALAFRTGRIRIGLLKAGIHTIFFLLEIEGCTAGWTDAPFSLGLVDPDYRRLSRHGANSGWTIVMCLHDSQTGMIHAVRVVTMTPTFSDVLDGLISEQRAALADFTPDWQRLEITRAYARWRHPAQIAVDASIIEIAGQPFPRPHHQPGSA